MKARIQSYGKKYAETVEEEPEEHYTPATQEEWVFRGELDREVCSMDLGFLPS
ncbi:MAG: hypothetical protein JWR35_3801 [Marmoricola sp.]|nr:hypothetical protein [Marmoricola sp.]